MANPSPLQVLKRRLDPGGKLTYFIKLSRGDGLRDQLQPEEQILSYTVALTNESLAAGLILGTGAKGPRLGADVISFQLEVDVTKRSASMFVAPDGTNLGIEISPITNTGNAIPFTVYAKVVHQ
jgi:hypothetical protein